MTTTRAAVSATCPTRVGRTGFLRPCGRTIVRDGECKLHADANDRAAAKQAAWAKAAATARRFAAHGIDVEATYDGTVVLTAAQAAKLADLLGGL